MWKKGKTAEDQVIDQEAEQTNNMAYKKEQEIKIDKLHWIIQFGVLVIGIFYVLHGDYVI